MAYLKDFRDRIKHGDFTGFLRIWEEYCYGDQPDGEEIVQTLEEVKQSEFAKPFGAHVERVLPLWRGLPDESLSRAALRLIVDLQTTHSEDLASLVVTHLEARFPEDPLFQEKLRLIGLRNRDNFQGAIRNFELLTHMRQGQFVFHVGGWGTGEVLGISFIREEVEVEFEHMAGGQALSFEQAFRHLIPLEHGHFYARRFGDPDALEEEAKRDHAGVIRLLLRDLGPKTASEIKEEMEELVIPVEDWGRWWQTARSKLKKDTKVETPSDAKQKFRLRTEEMPHEVVFHQALETKPGITATIQMVYNYLKNFAETLKNQEFKTFLEGRLRDLLQEPEILESQFLEIFFFLEDLGDPEASRALSSKIQQLTHPEKVIHDITILPFQKRALQIMQRENPSWHLIFLDLFLTTAQPLLRDYLVVALQKGGYHKELQDKVEILLHHPISYPEIFFWYFQKVTSGKEELPFSDIQGKLRFFEGLLIVLDYIEKNVRHRDLVKKILNLVVAERYKLVRSLMQEASLGQIKEYLLLATKCQSFSDHDIKILHALAEVVYPTLARFRKDKERGISEDMPLWTTQEGFERTHRRIQQIATVETVQNAKEIEAARELGDLRENAEFKAALEKRDRLQGELKMLSDQLSRARVVTPDDVPSDEVGIGSVVHCLDRRGQAIRFILLGPWDADPDKRILSLQSKLAQAMQGRFVGETFTFQGEDYTITSLENYFHVKNLSR